MLEGGGESSKHSVPQQVEVKVEAEEGRGEEVKDERLEAKARGTSCLGGLRLRLRGKGVGSKQ